MKLLKPFNPWIENYRFHHQWNFHLWKITHYDPIALIHHYVNKASYSESTHLRIAWRRIPHTPTITSKSSSSRIVSLHLPSSAQTCFCCCDIFFHKLYLSNIVVRMDRVGSGKTGNITGCDVTAICHCAIKTKIFLIKKQCYISQMRSSGANHIFQLMYFIQ